jgi:lysophospholipid acyltransferase (LPLAT)-like uncharacterized protein
MSPSRDSVSTESRLTRLDRLKVGIGIFLFSWLLRMLVWSYRVKLVSGARHIDKLLTARRPVVIAGWHEGTLSTGAFLLGHLVSSGFPLALLVSLSRDGEILARLAGKLGIEVVRGSTSRGGLSGLRRLYRTLSRDEISVGVAPDGPRGPARKCQPGALLLAQISGVPVLPVATAASSAWRLGSWDRMIVPKPFARLAVAIGEPIHVAESASAAELETEAQQLGESLDALTSAAQAKI